jgi:hypothetical protein
VLGANTWRIKGSELEFAYIKAGRAREDSMLTGTVKPINANEFELNVTGGFYGTEKKLRPGVPLEKTMSFGACATSGIGYAPKKRPSKHTSPIQRTAHRLEALPPRVPGLRV